MGVKGLWKVIESAGVPVPLETLEHKVLGVDVSIWLHQAVRGVRGPGGAAVANAHLLTLFHRICKLLFYRIRPIFVFDGGVPYLKKQTLASRKIRKEVATNKARQVRERLFKNLLKSQAVRTALGKSGPGPSSVHVPQVTKKEKDLFELLPLSEELEEENMSESQEEATFSSIVQCADLPNLHQFDFDSEEFKTMPLDAKHEILNELQGTRKQNSWAAINDMPQKSENFAEFQMARLMKRAKFQATLDSTRDEIQKAKVSQMEAELFGDMEKYVSHSKRIISEDSSHAIFVKKIKEVTKSKSEIVDEKSPESIKKVDRKGKGPLRKKKSVDKDFLTELAKVGIIRPENQNRDSDSDVESGEDCNDSWQEYKNEEENFLQNVGSLMENSGLTQDEILALIKQDQRENPVVEYKNEIYDGPSTSANAPGNIFNPDDSSSDEDNFIEVPTDVQSHQVEEGEKKDTSANNIDKLLGTKTNSLWMKIVQQKVDDMVQVNTLKTSPKKAIRDSRNLEKENVNVDEHTTCKDEPDSLKPIKISLDFEVKPLKLEDNIFSDIFTDFVCQPKSVKTNELVTEESQRSNQRTGGQELIVNKGMKLNLKCNSQTKIDYVDVSKSGENKLGVESSSTETLNGRVCDAKLPNNTTFKPQDLDLTPSKCQKPLQNGGNVTRNKTESYVSPSYWESEVEKLTQDEVGIMSSSDETDDEEHDTAVSTPQPPSSSHMKSQSPSRTQLEYQSVNTLQQMPHDEANTSNPSKSIVLKRKDKGKVETSLIRKLSSDDNTDLEASKVVVLKHQKLNDIHQVTPISKETINQASTKTTVLDSVKSLNSTKNSQLSGSSLKDDNCIEVEVGTRETVDMEGKKDKQEEIDPSPETTKKHKNISGEDSPPSKVAVKGIIMSGNLDKKDNINENIKQKDALNNIEASKDTDPKERSQTNGTPNIKGVQETGFDWPLDYVEDELKQLEGELASEQQALVAQAQQCDRLASSLNDQMYGESQHLLQLFGIPYLVAPMEAEAQCAFLNTANLTEGSITDDSDIFLFGGNSVYRNFFNQTRHVELFKTENIQASLGLDRVKMITMAVLCGSDYTEGLEGIGSVGAMEVLSEFRGEGIECLQNLKKWWSVAHKGVSALQHSKIRQKLTQVNIPNSFPNESVFEAYLVPEVDESKEKFTWAVPNVEALRVFTGEKFGWNSSKTDEILIPVMKKLKVRTFQRRIESYFTNIRLLKEPTVTSRRMQDAIAKARGTIPSDSNHPTGRSSTQTKVRQKQKNRKVRKAPESKQVCEESKPSCSEVMANTKPSKPTRTLLVDPSEINSKPKMEGRKGQKRKKGTGEDNDQSSQRGTDTNEISPRKVTKEDMFKSLLEKETISQREKDKLEMQEKKMNAANILLKQKEKIKR